MRFSMMIEKGKCLCIHTRENYLYFRTEQMHTHTSQPEYARVTLHTLN